MGFAVSYQTTELISPALQREMIDAAEKLSKARTWLSCEPPCLWNQDGWLTGASKPNFSPHPEDVAAAKSEGLPDGTLRDLLDLLCELSRQFDIDWEMAHDHSDGPLGYIRSGECDAELVSQCEEIIDFIDNLGEEGFNLDDF